MHHVLLATLQRVRRSNHVKLPFSVVSLLLDFDYLLHFLDFRILLDICETFIDMHIHRVQRHIFRVFRNVH